MSVGHFVRFMPELLSAHPSEINLLMPERKEMKILSFVILVLTTTQVFANSKNSIIENLKSIENISFNFEQNINGKIEHGNCTIQYPKKIFCEYSKSKNKILVSNGKSLVIKTRVSYYRYSLEQTPLNFILDKDFLINKIIESEERIIDNNLINYKILDKDNELNIFFDKNNYNFLGWQNKDLYQNFNITFISLTSKNRILPNNLFKLPIQN